MNKTLSDIKIFVVIVNYNGAEDSIECVESLLANGHKNIEIIIVDNNSDRTQKEKLKDKLSNSANLIYLNDNLGFSAGNNVAIKEALKKNAEYILLLNNDTIVEKDFLTKLLTASENNVELGITAPQINYYSNQNLIWSAGGYISKIRGSGFSRHENEADKGQVLRSYVDFVSGCCMLIKKEVFEKVGFLDEKYFLYLEDTDFCLRAINNGFKIYLVAGSNIYHKVNATTSRENSALPIYYTSRNRLYFSKKMLGKWYYAVLWYLYVTMLPKFILWYFKDQKENIKSVKRAFKDFHNNMMGRAAGL
ncbi:MAG: glycosyltransferase family 2 protein [Ignavibacteriaceae bacterium]